MKKKGIGILILCVLLIMMIGGTTFAQDISFLASSGVGVRASDRTMTIVQDLRTVMAISPTIMAIGRIDGSYETKTDLKEYGLGGEIAFLASKRITVHLSGIYSRTDVDSDSLKDADLDAGIFQVGVKWWFTDVATDINELIGLGATASFNEQTKDFGLFTTLEFWFGRQSKQTPESEG